MGSHLSLILERETSSHISLSSFVDHYLRLLDFPYDVVEALSAEDINLFEAEQLARITPERLKVSLIQAMRVRSEMLSTHVQARLSGERLQQRVAELLRALQNEAVEASENDIGSGGF